MTAPQFDLDIRSRLAVARLPAMPQMLLQLMELCQSDDVRMAELAALIARDAAMTTKILRVVNSSAYHRRSHLVSLEQSLIALGIDMVKTLLITESVFQIFDNFPQSGGPDLRGFWKHSLTAAITARLIAEKIGYAHVEEAYLAGLLHDVGRLALLATLPREYAVNFLARDDDDLCAVEQRTLQLTHAEAGAWLIEHWKLDSFLADSVLYHHEPVVRLENAHTLIRIVCLAHHLSSLEPSDPALEAVGALCNLNVNVMASIASRAEEQMAEAARYLGIDLAGADEVQAPILPVAPPAAHDGVKERLGEQVRNLMLASEAGRSFALHQGEANLLEAVTHSARMLFDFRDAIILLMDAAGQALNGTPTGEHRQRLAGFSIPLASNGIIAEAALERRLLFIDRDGEPLDVADEQLLRMLGTECLVCLSLGAKDRCLGLLVGGVQSWQLAALQKRESFLRAFGVQATNALQAGRAEIGGNGGGPNLTDEYREASRRVAHEVNNPLSIIKNYLGVLDRKLAKKEPIGGELSILNEEIDRVGQLVNGLTDLKPAPIEGTTELNGIVDDVVRLFMHTEYLPASVKIVAHTQDQPYDIDSDAGTLKQILMNLIKNAVEALPAGGTIEIGNNGLVNREGHLYVELWIKDTGLGIPAEVMAHLFSPVHSTKGEAHRGLGLSIVHSLVKKIHGIILCRSGKKGTTFEILLPVPGRTDRMAPARAHVRKPV